jgi:hypothetical protein
MEGMRKTFIVAALELGTTHSCCALSTRHKFEENPLSIRCIAGGRAHLSCQEKTCLLLDKEKKLVAFGYDAENRYSYLIMNKEQYDYYFFDRFTRSLHNNEVFHLK